MSSPTNVLLITVDSLRYDIVYDTSVSTPALDSLLDKGIDFSRAYASGPYTRVSVPAIVSGTFPWMYGGNSRLSDQRPYIGDAFSRSGFSTGAFHSNPYLGSEFGYDRNFERFFDGKTDNSSVANLRRYVTRTLSRDSFLYKILRYLYKTGEETFGFEIGTPYVEADELNNQVIEWLRTASTPGFGWVHYMDVHHPYVPHDGTISENIGPNHAVRLRQRMIESPEKLSSKDVDTLRHLYKGEVEYTDRHIKELLDVVDDEWGVDDTLVLFTSDHGEAFGEHGEYGHPDVLYDEVTRVPFAVRSPMRDGNTIDRPISGIDILPTLVAEANIDYDRELVGTSVFEVETDERRVFTHTGTSDEGAVMVTDGTWKLIAERSTDTVELYNLEDDPIETADLSSEHDGIVTAFIDEIDRQVTEFDAGTKQTESQGVSDDVQERLRRLGYSE